MLRELKAGNDHHVAKRYQHPHQKGDLIDNAVRINVGNVVGQVRGSTPILAALVDRGALTVVGAVYSLDTGKVAWLPGIRPRRWPGAMFRANGNAP